MTLVDEVKELLVKVCEQRDSESFRLLASFVAAVEVGYVEKDLARLVEGWGDAA